MKRLALIFLALACAQKQPVKSPAERAQAEEAALAAQPALEPLQSSQVPLPKVTTLPNGLAVWIVERPGDGMESVQFVARGGASADPAGKPGLASLTAALMETGAAGRSQTEQTIAADMLGATLAVEAQPDALVVSASAMSQVVEKSVALLADVALRPNLAEAEWARVREQREARLLSERAEPRIAARRAFRRAIYGTAPLAWPVEGTAQSVKSMQLAEVRAFHAAISPRDCALIAVGGAKPEEVLRALKSAFAGWTPSGARPLAPPPQAKLSDTPERLLLVDFPGKPQAVLIVGQPAVPRSSPDYLALRAFNSALGGSFTSRLNQNLREQHGYTYGAGSQFSFGVSRGPFAASTSVKTDVTGAALGEVLSELNRIVAAPLAPEELDKARALLAYELVGTLSHADRLAEAVQEIYLGGLSPDELSTTVARLQALTPDSVLAAARRALDPARMTISIAGDAAKVGPQLEPLHLPKPVLRDAAGEPLK
jgi:zinc protease